MRIYEEVGETFNTSRLSGEIQEREKGTHRWQKTRRLWCHRTGRRSPPPSAREALYVFARCMKCPHRPSTTWYGSAYFLSRSTRMKRELGPESVVKTSVVLNTRICRGKRTGVVHVRQP